MTDAVVALPVVKDVFYAIMDQFEVPPDSQPPPYVGVVEMDCEVCGHACEITQAQLTHMKAHPTCPVRCFICELILLNFTDSEAEAIEEVDSLLWPYDGLVVTRRSAA